MRRARAVLAQAGQRRDDEVKVGAGLHPAGLSVKLEVGRQRDARQVAAVFTVLPASRQSSSKIHDSTGPRRGRD
jgi:hypothetical protein